jgi:hypothetical protein
VSRHICVDGGHDIFLFITVKELQSSNSCLTSTGYIVASEGELHYAIYIISVKYITKQSAP